MGPHLTEHRTPRGQGQGPGGPGKREEGLPRRSAAPLGRGLETAARRRRQAPTAGPASPPGCPGGGKSSATGWVAAVACSRAALWGPRKRCAQGAGGMRPPRNGWRGSGSRSPVLTSASCWCVPRRRRPLAGPGRRAPLRARSPASPQPQRASRSVRAGNRSGGSYSSGAAAGGWAGTWEGGGCGPRAPTIGPRPRGRQIQVRL